MALTAVPPPPACWPLYPSAPRGLPVRQSRNLGGSGRTYRGRTLQGHGTDELASCYGSIYAKITLSAEPIIIIFVRLAFSLWLDARCLVPAMARCDLAPCCSPEKSVKAAAALCSGRTLAAFSGGSRTQPTPHPDDTPFGSVLVAWFLLWLGA